MKRLAWRLLRNVIAAALYCGFTSAGTLIGASASVEPELLEFDSRQDEPVFFSLDVSAPDSSNINAEFEGFYGDRRVSSKGDGKFLVEIAPLTVELGTLRGKIVITDADTDNEIVEPVQITGRIEPQIHVKPTRIFLGSIGHGEKFADRKEHPIELRSETGAFEIKSIQVLGIEDATWTVDPSIGTTSKVHRVSVIFSPDAVGDGFPYGALATEPILIHTGHEEAPLLEIPVMGMLSINTSGRDYSEFLYNGNVRWEGPWATPNVAGAILATGLVFWCGLTAGLFVWMKRFRWVQIAITTVALAGMLVGCHLLALTYSRGGWIALGVGTFALLVGIRKPRLYPILLALSFAGAVLLLPAGLDRTTSASQLNEDKSIHHRLLLWKGALQMMGEHPWNGVGAGNFGEVFERDYQLPGHKATYTTAINDFLTLGAERGVIPLILSTSGLLTIVGIGAWVGWTRRWPALTGAGATIVTFLVACWFSSIAFSWKNSSLLLAAAAGILLTTLVLFRRASKSSRHSQLRPALTGGISILFLVTAVTLAAARMSLTDRATQTALKTKGVEAILIAPRDRFASGTIVYVLDRKEEPRSVLKQIVRPVAASGWNVICAQVSAYPSEAAPDLRNLLADVQLHDSNPTLLAGHGGGAQSAVLATRMSDKVRGVATRDMPRSGVLPNAPEKSPPGVPLAGSHQKSESEFADIATRPDLNLSERTKSIHHQDTDNDQNWAAAISKFASEMKKQLANSTKSLLLSPFAHFGGTPGTLRIRGRTARDAPETPEIPSESSCVDPSKPSFAIAG